MGKKKNKCELGNSKVRAKVKKEHMLEDSNSAQIAFYLALILIFVGYAVFQIWAIPIVSYIFYGLGIICVLFAISSVDNPRRFIYLYCLLSIYMLLNQGASTDLKIYPVWFFRAFSFIIFLLFCAIDGKRMRAMLS